jgi:pyruvate kinase
LQYLALRGHELRDLQDPLVALGLSSLGGSEGHVQASVDAVLTALSALDHQPCSPAPPAPIGFARSRAILAARSEALLGPAPVGRPTRMMVTMPSEAATDPELVSVMLARGMDCMRINCAHDTAAQWRAMRENLLGAERRVGRRARVIVDLPGPKLRTGQIASEHERDKKGDYVRVRIGDRLLLTRDGAPAVAVPQRPRPIAQFGCSLPGAFAVTRPGHHVWLDDGKLGGVVECVEHDRIELLVTAAGGNGSKLRPEKGINLPDAVLDIDLLGTHSHEALRFAIEAADIIGLSFVSHARDVKRVDEYLDLHGRPDLGMVLKIETRRAFDHLPGLLLAALGARRPAGVMIARGDLAVECGYERLAEVQEEILWLCQAAHVPVIWATEVLDRLARTGRPSRAEITDAAMGERAECVMLNKGPRIVEAITVLDDILRRMERHQRKKRSLLARLGASDYVHSER